MAVLSAASTAVQEILSEVGDPRPLTSSQAGSLTLTSPGSPIPVTPSPGCRPRRNPRSAGAIVFGVNLSLTFFDLRSLDQTVHRSGYSSTEQTWRPTRIPTVGRFAFATTQACTIPPHMPPEFRRCRRSAHRHKQRTIPLAFPSARAEQCRYRRRPWPLSSGCRGRLPTQPVWQLRSWGLSLGALASCPALRLAVALP